MKISKQNGKIIFEFSERSPRYNPYMSDSEQHLLGTYPTFTGLIVRHKGYEEMGFAVTIDMDYKDKGDQVGDFLVMWHEGEEAFRKICTELGLSIHEFSVK